MSAADGRGHMPTYDYIAKTSEGDEIQAEITSSSRYVALSELQTRGLTVTTLEEKGAAASGAGRRHGRKGAKPSRYGPGKRVRVSMTEKAVFCRQLAISVGAGVPLRESLESIAEDADNREFGALLQTIIRDLHSGRSFSQAISRHERVFGTLFGALIRAAEEAGSLAQTLEYLAATTESTERLQRRIRSIAAYPAFVAVFFGIVCLVMTLFVLPQFEAVFAGYHAKLPLITRVVFGVNRFVITNLFFIVAGIFAVVVAAMAYSRTTRGRLRTDTFKLRLPIAGTWIKKLAIARFTRNLAIMVRGGVPIATAMEITSDVCGNEAVRLSLLSARENVIRGNDMSSSIEREGIFPSLVIRMIRVGESSGQLPQVLEKVSSMYEEQVESAMTLATSLLEPVIICVFGAIITCLVLAIYVPVFTVSTTAGSAG